MGLKRVIAFFLLTVMVLVTLLPTPLAHAQSDMPPAEVLKLLETLTPEERVGQLFLVTFSGTATDVESPIYNLVVNHHIGGVVLRADNDNFIESPNTLSGVHQLITDLQSAEWEASSFVFNPNVGTQTQSAYLPLFIGVEQDGDGYPTDQILNGLTAMPSAMSLGATWRPELAQQMGAIQGSELAALGINLYLGPSLDVLDVPNPTARNNIGTRSFGGDPFWVGEMGRAYINGLHAGSNRKMLVIAKHFPGLGGSDRSVDEEVATVRKTMEQLKQVELAPFFAVTGNAPDPFSTADGLLVSHIRFQGLQGNIRATTRPVSFDQTALGDILALPELTDWHANGGLLVSDDLGSRSVRTFYAPANEAFSPEFVARDAFLAGNDLLYLGNITSGNLDDTYFVTLDVLRFFVQRYREDQAFANQVDEAVTRILTRKYQLFDGFELSHVTVLSNRLSSIGLSQSSVFEVARRSTTLISPEIQELTTLFPSPPVLRDRIVFLTDTSNYTQCSTCPEKYSLSVSSLQEAVARLYGQNAGGQISEGRLSSYTLDDLAALLNEIDVELMEYDIDRANWIVLVLSDIQNGQPEIISRFLSERQDLLREKRVILFSFTAPYYLDATDISKLNAYYGLYSKQPVFIDVAARFLFQELTPLGFSPVSISGTNYDLNEIMRPDPNQVITLSLDVPPASVLSNTPTSPSVYLTQTLEPTSTPPEPTPIPLLRIGDTINIRTGVILDRNGHIVPDGTVVRFTMLLSGEGGGIIQQVDQNTVRGVARASFALEKPGLVEINAESEPATLSDLIQIDVSLNEAAVVTVIAPIPSETSTPVPVTPTPIEEDDFVTGDGFPRLNTWAMTVLILTLGAGLAYWAGNFLRSSRWGLRWGISVILGGLAGYNYTVLGLPGSPQFLLESGLKGVLGFSILGGVLGWIVAWLWAKRA